MPRESAAADARCGRYARALGALTGLFALRVAGQAVQRWAPLPVGPAFDALQGSPLPYGLLLTIQLFLVALMGSITYEVATGKRRRNSHASRVLGWVGGVYMAGSLGRIAAGLLLSTPPAWFTAWIPALFHVVLAGFVVTLAAYYATSAQAED